MRKEKALRAVGFLYGMAAKFSPQVSATGLKDSLVVAILILDDGVSVESGVFVNAGTLYGLALPPDGQCDLVSMCEAAIQAIERVFDGGEES
jgi:hypothetical protein